MNQNVEQLQKTIDGLETEINNNNVHYVQTSEQQKRKIEELKALLETVDNAIKAQMEHRDDLMKTISSNEKTIKTNNEKIAEQAKTITDLDETIKGLKDTMKQVEDGRKHYQSEFQTKNTELHNMTQLKNQLEKQIAAGSPVVALTVVQDQVVALTQEKSDLDKQILDKDKQIDELKTEVDKLQTQLASKSSSDDHREDTKNTKPRKTQAEHKAEFQSKNQQLLEELLKQLREKVDIPVGPSD
jgi:chromosome segregation ATPase